MVPSTGRLLAATGSTPAAENLVLTGGGDLRVQAGGDIYGGLFEDDWGNASISAGGALTLGTDSTFGQETAGNSNLQNITTALPASSTQIYPVLAVGNGTFDVSARGGIALDAVTNSTTLPLVAGNAAAVGGQDAAFFTYAATPIRARSIW